VVDTVIDPDHHNNTLDDIADALTASIANDGQTPILANLPMSGFKHTGAADATATGQYLTYGQAGANLGSFNDAIEGAPRVDVASVAGTTVLETALSNYVRITGTNAITAFTLTDGHWRDVLAGGAFSVTAGASLLVDGLASGTVYTFASGDRFKVYGEASSVVRLQLFQPPRLDAVTATTEVVNSAAETTVYTKAIPGGTLGIDRALRLTLIGDYFNNSGDVRDLAVKGKYGATTFFSISANTVAGSATRKTVRLQLELFAKGATNSQVGVGTYLLDAGTATAGAVTVAEFRHLGTVNGHNAIAIDSTAAQDLVVTVQHSTNHASLSFRILSARLEVIR
jgi:hypothetical protein